MASEKVFRTAAALRRPAAKSSSSPASTTSTRNSRTVEQTGWLGSTGDDDLRGEAERASGVRRAVSGGISRR
jgi:hypothetical protein